jgi:hypothetical protein
MRWAIDSGSGLIRPTFLTRADFSLIRGYTRSAATTRKTVVSQKEPVNTDNEDERVDVSYLLDEEFLWKVWRGDIDLILFYFIIIYLLFVYFIIYLL